MGRGGGGGGRAGGGGGGGGGGGVTPGEKTTAQAAAIGAVEARLRGATAQARRSNRGLRGMQSLVDNANFVTGMFATGDFGAAVSQAQINLARQFFGAFDRGGMAAVDTLARQQR